MMTANVVTLTVERCSVNRAQLNHKSPIFVQVGVDIRSIKFPHLHYPGYFPQENHPLRPFQDE